MAVKIYFRREKIFGGVSFQSVDYAVSFDPSRFTVSNPRVSGTLLAGFTVVTNIDNAAGVIRIYDVLFDYDVLLDTDAFVRQVIQGPEFQRTMATDEFHYLLGKYVRERERKLGIKETSVLSAAFQYGVPIFTSSPGDSSIGMNVAAMALRVETETRRPLRLSNADRLTRHAS